MRTDYIIIGACALLTIGILALFIQVVKLGWHIKTLDNLVFHIVNGDKIVLKKYDESDD